MYATLRTASSAAAIRVLFFLLAGFCISPSQQAFALICGDLILDPGEDCELLSGLCCDPLTCQFLAAGTTCRLGSGDSCDPTETCSGASATCPADVLQPLGTTCRAGSGDLCDLDEVCLGLPLLPCPADIITPAGVPCRVGSLDACDPTENCTGSAGDACPADVVTPAGTTCRAGSGDLCDPDETCTGTPGAICPIDNFALVGTTCRPGSGDLCDLDEVCLGVPLLPCPADIITPAGVPCRVGSLDACDPTENCTGAAGDACPADMVTPAGTTCRAGSGDLCDPDETCTGTPGATCPIDNFALVGTTCRTSSGVCDSAETCNGMAGGACPADTVALAGTPCDDAMFCTISDACDGAGNCDGGSRDCSDPNPCTADSCNEIADTCDNVATPSVCDDGNPCTADACDVMTGCSNDATPRNTCLVAGLGKISVRDHGTNDEKDFFRWSWRRGTEVLPADLGSPLTVSTYAMCVYDHSASVPSLVASLVVPPNAELWSERNGRVRYVDRTGASDGVRRIRVRSGDAGRTKAQFGASGVPLDLPPPATVNSMFIADPSLLVQLVNSDDTCWTSTFGPTGISKNETGRFKAIERP